MPEVVVKKDSIESVEFFGSIDRKKNGDIASNVPSWYLRQQKEDLENDIDRTQGTLDRKEAHPSQEPKMRANLEKMKTKRDAIEESKPKFNGIQQDAIAEASDGLGKKIADSMFTLSDMKKGVADAHEEARRMSEPIIKLSEKELLFAQKSGCKISRDGKVNRIDAERAWKIMRRALGENSNTETLRRA
jgi:hypothetical protein